MSDAARQAPWIISENDRADKRYINIHNTFTGKTFRMMKKDVGSPLGEGIGGKWRDFLLAEKMIVDPEKVTPMLESLLFELMNSYPGSEADAVFMPTYDCQLNCEYCYNADLRSSAGGKRLPAGKIASRLVKFYSETPAQTWRLRVTGGGEPSLETEYVAQVAGLVRREAEKRERFFDLNMVSNGVDLKGDRLRKLMRAGLSHVQITLDPDHDKKRVYKDGSGSLDDIIGNILEFPRELIVSIASNVKRGEEKKFKAMVRKIRPLRGRVKGLSPNLTVNKLPERLVITGAKKMSRLAGPRDMDTLLACFDILDEAGFPRQARMPRIVCEAFVAREAMFINYKGETSFCPGLEAMPEYQAGARAWEQLRARFDFRVANPQWKEHCYEDGEPCPYLPACFGGCRMISVSQGAGWETINCEFENFDRITRHELASM